VLNLVSTYQQTYHISYPRSLTKWINPTFNVTGRNCIQSLLLISRVVQWNWESTCGLYR